MGHYDSCYEYDKIHIGFGHEYPLHDVTSKGVRKFISKKSVDEEIEELSKKLEELKAQKEKNENSWPKKVAFNVHTNVEIMAGLGKKIGLTDPHAISIFQFTGSPIAIVSYVTEDGTFMCESINETFLNTPTEL
ncbi:MAG: hypothetical protein P4L79_11015 [Legionella sp.]|uniref:hypothetical protein n=1 Tax=Legionella sp. TaxID=459 RepID=UPI00284FA351|nr:hypothetical protein [Legionella sp.]